MTPTTSADMAQLHQTLCREAGILHTKKAKHYSHPSDPLSNFRLIEGLTDHQVSSAMGVLVRLSDKLSRMGSFIASGVNHVPDESVRDTTLDIINYAVILYALLQESTPRSGEIQPHAPTNPTDPTDHVTTDADDGPYAGLGD